jgi:hypothetical protein
MPRNKNAGLPCRVCGGDTEAVPVGHLHDDPERTIHQLRCTEDDCAGRDWWVQARSRRGN